MTESPALKAPPRFLLTSPDVSPRFQALLNPTRALAFRITHVRNIRWLLEHGLWSRSSETTDPTFVTIGNEDLIGKRQTRPVPVPPGGVLADYIPFYFTPFSPMLFNIHTGRSVTQRPNEEIVILVSSLEELRHYGVDVVITDRHAYLEAARYSNDLNDVRDFVPWPALQARMFKKDPLDLEPFERYQAEALAHRHVPVQALCGVVCYSEAVRSAVEEQSLLAGSEVDVITRPGWYFS